MIETQLPGHHHCLTRPTNRNLEPGARADTEPRYTSMGNENLNQRPNHWTKCQPIQMLHWYFICHHSKSPKVRQCSSIFLINNLSCLTQIQKPMEPSFSTVIPSSPSSDFVISPSLRLKSTEASLRLWERLSIMNRKIRDVMWELTPTGLVGHWKKLQPSFQIGMATMHGLSLPQVLYSRAIECPCLLWRIAKIQGISFTSAKQSSVL